MRSEDVDQHTLTLAELVGRGIHDAVVSRSVGDGPGRFTGGGKLLQRRGKSTGIPGELSRSRISQILALPAHRHLKEAGDDRCDDQGEDPEYQDDESQRTRILLASPA